MTETEFSFAAEEELCMGDDDATTLLERQVAQQTQLLQEMTSQLTSLRQQLCEQAEEQRELRLAIDRQTQLIEHPWRKYSPLHWLRRRYASRLFHLKQYGPQSLRLPTWYAQCPPLANPPSISLVTPSYNQAEYLPRTIASVLSQQYPRLEYFIQDGGSKDGSVDVLRAYAAQLDGWVSKPDNGQADAINQGFARTTGEIMGWINSDDMLLPGALNYVANFFQRHPEVDVVYGSRVIIDADDNDIGRWLLPPHDDKLLRWVDYVPQETLFWRREIWNRSGARIDDSFDFAMDWDLLLRLQAAGAKFACLPRFLGAFRVTETTKTSTNINTVGQQEVDRLRQRTLGFVPSQLEVSKQTRLYILRHLWRRTLNKLRIVRY